MVSPVPVTGMDWCRCPDGEGDCDGVGCAAAVRVDDVGRTSGVDRGGDSRDHACRVVDREAIRQGWRPDLDQLLAIEGRREGDRLSLGGDQLAGPVVHHRVLESVADAVSVGIGGLERV